MDYRIEQLRYLLREDPSSRVFYQLAEVLRKQGEVAEAVAVLHAGLGHHPRYLAAWVSLGRAHLALGDLPQAERAFERALELDPQNAVAAKMIGEAALAQEDWTRAARAFRLAHELAPADDTVGGRLELVEERLAAIAAPAAAARPAPPPVVQVSGEEPFTVPGHGDTGVWQSTQEVFASMAASAPASESAPDSASEPAPPDESPDGFPHEVETAFEPPPVPEEEEAAEDGPPGPDADALGPEPPTAPGWGGGLSVADAASSQEAEPPPAPASEETAPGPAGVEPLEAEAPEGPGGGPLPVNFLGLEPGFDEGAWEDDEYDEDDGDEELDEEELAGELPLPTMTLARLAADQGDLELAERTLESLLEGDAAPPGAGDLLSAVRARRRAGAADAPAAAALRLWLEGIRLAAERLSR